MKRHVLGFTVCAGFIVGVVASAHATPTTTPATLPSYSQAATKNAAAARLIPLQPLAALAVADPATAPAEEPAAVPTPEAAAPPAAAPEVIASDVPAIPTPAGTVEEMFTVIYRAVTKKNWFMVAGAGLALLCWGLIYALGRKWPIFEKRGVRWATVGLMAGILGLSNAWLAQITPDTQTLMGALRVFVAAVFAYVTAKKVIGPALGT